MARLTMSGAVREAMIAHARRDAPRECCGLLVGRDSQVDEAVAGTNLEAGTTRYLLDPREHLAVLKRLRDSDRDVIGGYHSHPRSPARPSPTDIAESFSAHFVYVIVSLAEPDAPVVRAFRIEEGIVSEVAIEVGA